MLFANNTVDRFSKIRSRLAKMRAVVELPRKKMHPDRIVCVHFPKAAGTSLSWQFGQILGTKLCLDYAHDPLIVKDYNSVDFPAGKIMVFGHFHPACYDRANAFRMTFLRHPLDNLISIYSFWKKMPEHGNFIHRRFLEEQPSLLAFSQHASLRCLMSEVYFGGYDMNRFDFIGFYENRVVDLAKLSEKIGVNISPDIRYNSTRYDDEDESRRHDQDLRKKLTDVLSQDIRFYETLYSSRGH